MAAPPNLEKSTTELGSMEDFDLCEYLWESVVDELNEQDNDDGESDSPCNYPESIFATQLPDHWWIAYGVHAFEYDLLGGGVRQFLDNHNGLTNKQTSAALEAIGHTDLATAFTHVGTIYKDFVAKRFEIGRDLTDEEYESADSDLDKLLLEEAETFRKIHRGLDLRASLATYIRGRLILYKS